MKLRPKKKILKAFACVLFLTHALLLNAQTLEDFGLLPNVRSVEISPNGEYIALIVNNGEQEYLKIKNLSTKKSVGGFMLDGVNARSLLFVDDDTVILKGTDTKHTFGSGGKFTLSGSYAYIISSKKVILLMSGTKNIHPAQTGVGRIVGYDPRKNRVLIPAFEKSKSGLYHLYSASLKTGLGVKYKLGNAHTIDWFVDGKGRVLAREDYDNKKQMHRIYSYINGSAALIYEIKTPQREISLEAVSSNEKSLFFIEAGEINQISLYDGAITKTSIASSSHDIGGIQVDINRKLVAVTHSGLLPFTKLQNPKISKAYQRIEKTFKNSQVSYQSSTLDNKKMVVRVSGNDSAGGYYFFESEKNNLVELGREYPNINPGDIGQITTVSYEARDGTKVPTILTWPPKATDEDQKKNLALIALPHGGPRSHDQIAFDWLAQYFATKGYLVMQPNFRGSTGFGLEHKEKGDGEWGKAMQDDVSDGVQVLIDQGYADANRVCIVGASYGGYSALAGGAFSPKLYKCVIAVAPVSDLPNMLRDNRRRYGSDHWVNRYWTKIIGDSKVEREKLKEISPVNFADNFVAPTLLIHGRNDTVVPISQSKRMYKALKKAKKEVELVELKGEDHWLSTSRTRLQMLKTIDQFIGKHNPA